jgi:hypothetical protein
MQQIEVRLKGAIDRDWSSWLGGFEITHDADGNSTMMGPVRDQAELSGVLSRLGQLGIELISVNTLSKPPVVKIPGRGGGKSKRKN